MINDHSFKNGYLFILAVVRGKMRRPHFKNIQAMQLHRDMSRRELDDYCQLAHENTQKNITVSVTAEILNRIRLICYGSTKHLGIQFKEKRHA